MRIGGARLARGGSVRCSIKQVQEARVCFKNSAAVSHIQFKTWDAIFQRSKRDTFKVSCLLHAQIPSETADRIMRKC
jgi:hypothetical protein